VNGTTFTFNYFTDSNQINSVVATVSGGANVTTTYLRDSADKSRIAQVGVQSGNSAVGQVFQEQAVSNGAYPSNGFNQQDQIVGQTTTRKDVADDGTLSSTASKDYLYTYDPNKDDALTTVKDGATNTTLYGYALDNIGNRTGTSLGTANSVNDYSNLTYNSRHDLIDDGTNAYGWDAQDRLISVIPKSPASGSQEEKMGYNSQSQMLWQNVYAWNTTTSAWEFSRAEHFVYDASNMTAELDQSNALLKSYAWGPTGLIAETDFPADPANPNPSAGGDDLSGDLGPERERARTGRSRDRIGIRQLSLRSLRRGPHRLRPGQGCEPLWLWRRLDRQDQRTDLLPAPLVQPNPGPIP